MSEALCTLPVTRKTALRSEFTVKGPRTTEGEAFPPAEYVRVMYVLLTSRLYYFRKQRVEHISDSSFFIQK